MHVKHHVALDRARKAAKALARAGGITYQQALDQIAQEGGYPHWNSMLKGPPSPALPAPRTRGAARVFFETDGIEYLRPSEPTGTTMAAVEALASTAVTHASRGNGLELSNWISGALREAAKEVLPRRHAPYGHSIRQLPLDARMAAEALDPGGAPHLGDDLVVRCPGHEDSSRSLTISGAGPDLRMACVAGCLTTDLQDLLSSRLAHASE
ncbi:hypothetical protein [Sphingomonas sp. 3-13AW]|uniref:hypothetical protein n=1 Tax=Sphingomonas sp. 3-13AW TaxID=3050450 RepID=UPI003BB64CA5